MEGFFYKFLSHYSELAKQFGTSQISGNFTVIAKADNQRRTTHSLV